MIVEREVLYAFLLVTMIAFAVFSYLGSLGMEFTRRKQVRFAYDALGILYRGAELEKSAYRRKIIENKIRQLERLVREIRKSF